VLASVARTIGQWCLDLTTVLTTMLRAPRPTVPADLQRTGPSRITPANRIRPVFGPLDKAAAGGIIGRFLGR
jgi:hypothetical protein